MSESQSAWHSAALLTGSAANYTQVDGAHRRRVCARARVSANVCARSCLFLPAIPLFFGRRPSTCDSCCAPLRSVALLPRWGTCALSNDEPHPAPRRPPPPSFKSPIVFVVALSRLVNVIFSCDVFQTTWPPVMELQPRVQLPPA